MYRNRGNDRPAARDKRAWFADIDLNEPAGQRSIAAEIRLRTPTGCMVHAVGRAVRDPGDKDVRGNSAPKLAIARALRDLARLIEAQT
jgi:hypothetical protein